MTTSWIILSIYLAILFLISWAAKSKINNSTDFLLAGRKLGPFMLAGTLAATHFGGGFVLGEASWGVQYGLSGIWYGAACGIGLLLLSLFASKLRSLEVFTAPEILERRYNSPGLRNIAASLSLIALIGILAAQVWASSAIFEVLGLDPTIAAIVTSLFFITYTAMSGLWAAVLTDFVQVILGTVGVTFATWVAWTKIGSLGELQNRLNLMFDNGILTQNADAYLNPYSAGIELIGLTVFATAMYTLIGQDFYQRLFAAKDKRSSFIGAVLGGSFLCLLSFLPALTGLFSLVISDQPESLIASPKTAVPALLMGILGNFWGAIFISAILAAIMSTADSLLSSASSHIVKDFYQKYRPDSTDKTLLRLSIASTVFVGLFALVFSFIFKDIISLLIYAYDFYTAGVFVPLMAALLWKKANKTGAYLSLLGGLAVVFAKQFNIIQFEGSDWSFVLAFVVSTILMVVGSLWNRKNIPEASTAKS